jgi:hypothetical protein
MCLYYYAAGALSGWPTAGSCWQCGAARVDLERRRGRRLSVACYLLQYRYRGGVYVRGWYCWWRRWSGGAGIRGSEEGRRDERRKQQTAVESSPITIAFTALAGACCKSQCTISIGSGRDEPAANRARCGVKTVARANGSTLSRAITPPAGCSRPLDECARALGTQVPDRTSDAFWPLRLGRATPVRSLLCR